MTQDMQRHFGFLIKVPVPDYRPYRGVCPVFSSRDCALGDFVARRLRASWHGDIWMC